MALKPGALTSFVGTKADQLQVNVLDVTIRPGDRFLLCSDGLSGYFEDNPEDLGKLLAISDEQVATREMIRAANEAGG